MVRSLILDFDGSVRPLPGASLLSLGEHQEAIRFGCRMARLKELGGKLAPSLSHSPSVVFLGSGDFHHVSYLLIERLRAYQTPVQVVVFDNHPDNMRYPFGIHCGSWVRQVSRLPFVTRVHVVGITSTDVEAVRLWENHLAPLYSGKVVYYCVGRDLRAMRAIGIRRSRSYPSASDSIEALLTSLAADREPVYLSIDKDVLDSDVVQTNWDQGTMRLEELAVAIWNLRPRLIGSDVVGDVSRYRYRSLFKRFLSGLDGQTEIPEQTLKTWQEQHRRVNTRLLSLFGM